MMRQVKTKIRTGNRLTPRRSGIGSQGTLTPHASQFHIWLAEPESAESFMPNPAADFRRERA
jgi:hypothetical protein